MNVKNRVRIMCDSSRSDFAGRTINSMDRSIFATIKYLITIVEFSFSNFGMHVKHTTTARRLFANQAHFMYSIIKGLTDAFVRPLEAHEDQVTRVNT
jgi:Mg2+ and Co2+ transporter CorA